MGIENPGVNIGGPVIDPPPTPNFGYSTDQFFKVFGPEGEPFSLEREPFDNPPFLWPKNIVRDSVGEHKIQRGYMRSLISDPKVDLSGQMKNRRLFFQFNPQVLVRSVQQSVGSMLPLLQDPAQLTQPVPGTTSFGFELLFNREHEVNAGHNNPNQEWLSMPNGDAALVSEVGVLADLLVLDSIVGQGLSSDMISALVNRAKQQYASINEENRKIREDMEKIGIDEETLDYQPVEPIGDDQMAEIFRANLGNSAFLNPLPFRVLFSSLFMVEGIATSVEVVFQKFSRTMVPTQCKVVINMYALYFGFAKKNTFIFDNLVQSAETAQDNNFADSEILRTLYNAVSNFDGRLLSQRGGSDWPTENNPTFEVVDIKISDHFSEALKNTEIKDANFSFELEYFFGTTNTIEVSDDTLKSNKIQLLQDGKKSEFNAKGTKKVKGLRAILNGENLFKSQMPKEPSAPIVNPYLTFRIITTVKCVSPTGTQLSFPMVGETVKYVEWTTLSGYSPVSHYHHDAYTNPNMSISRIIAEQ